MGQQAQEGQQLALPSMEVFLQDCQKLTSDADKIALLTGYQKELIEQKGIDAALSATQDMLHILPTILSEKTKITLWKTWLNGFVQEARQKEDLPLYQKIHDTLQPYTEGILSKHNPLSLSPASTCRIMRHTFYAFKPLGDMGCQHAPFLAFYATHSPTVVKTVYEELQKKLIDCIHTQGNQQQPLSPQEKFAVENIKILLSKLLDPDQKAEVEKAILQGRFDRKIFGLHHSMILTEEMGIFLLLNAVSTKEYDMLAQTIDNHYLQSNKLRDAYSQESIKTLRQGQILRKLVIGSGSFGKVRFSLCLIPPEESNLKYGAIVGVKKSLHPVQNRIGNHDLVELLNNLENDVEGGELCRHLKGPRVHGKALPETGLNSHSKSYLFLDLIPQDNASKFFAKPENQTWVLQKAYLMSLISQMLVLQNKGCFPSDLKPANTLYDPKTRQTTLIDLGGAIQTKQANFCAYVITQYVPVTRLFCAPELLTAVLNIDQKHTVNLKKAGAHTIGKMIKDIVKNRNSHAWQSDCNDKKLLEDLIQNLTNPDPNKRLEVDAALIILDKL